MRPHARILLVGPHATLMGSIAARLEYEHHCSVVGMAATIKEAAVVLAESRADILLIDIDGLEPDWQQRLGRLRAGQPALRLILTCSVLDDRRVKETLAVKASGVLVKDELPSKIGVVVKEVLAGGVWFPPELRELVVIDSDGARLPTSSLGDADYPYSMLDDGGGGP